MAVKRYDGSAWQTVAGLGAQGPAATSSSIATWVKTASGGETSLSGNDDNSQSLSYTVGQELVFINGTLLKRGSDYTATNGTSITGLTALAANDVATVWTVNAFSVTNAISNGLVTTTGDIIYASAANTPARLAIGSTDQVLKVSGGVPVWGAPTFVGCDLRKTANQTIANATTTKITFDSENFDTNGFHDNATNNTRITIPTGFGGKYLFSFISSFENNSVGFRSIIFYVNGVEAENISRLANSGTIFVSQSSLFLNLNAGDYVEFAVYQNSGSTISINAGTASQNLASTRFSCQYLGA
jgi:hypothetical protein